MKTRLYTLDIGTWRDRIEGSHHCPAGSDSHVEVRKDSVCTTLWVECPMDLREGRAKIYLDEEGVKDLIASLKTPAPKD